VEGSCVKLEDVLDRAAQESCDQQASGQPRAESQSASAWPDFVANVRLFFTRDFEVFE
jgi:hypothetical protein